jgi:hypothetical protein
MVENLLLQQVLLYTREHVDPSFNSRPRRSRSRSSSGNPLWVRRSGKRPENFPKEHLVLTSSKRKHDYDEEATLCLIESNSETSSNLIETILTQYNQRRDHYSRFDQNLIDLILKRNRQRTDSATCTNHGYYFRLQWLAIGLVIDRFFFFMYFTATFVSYFVTLWLIPFSHPNLTINIDRL